MQIKGRCNEATIYTDEVDEMTLKQVKQLCDQNFIAGSKIAIMPDCHAGKGCVIGTTMTLKDTTVPNLVGVDIGCGMKMVKLGKKEIDLPALDAFISAHVPHGFDVNEEIQEEFPLDGLRCFFSLKDVTRLKKSLGSLGGGNHFIEIDKGEDGNQYLVIHSGSRNLGVQVADIYQNKAIQYQTDLILNKRKKAEEIIKTYKAEGRQSEIQSALVALKATKVDLSMPEELAPLSHEDFLDYLHDMEICQAFAVRNRANMAKRIVSFLGLDFDALEKTECIHNYIDTKNMILRKGSISAQKGEKVIIPINMRDGTIIGIGKGNPDYNYSAPHGAGRRLSRTKAREEIPMEKYQDSMKGIYTSCVNEGTLDESPFAYKDESSILKNIQDTVEVQEILKPIYNFKASDLEPSPWSK